MTYRYTPARRFIHGLRRSALGFLLVLLPLVPLVAQPVTPIDISRAREFTLLWKKVVGGETSRPKYIVSPCGAAGMNMLSVPTSTGGFGCFTYPRIDTTRQVIGWGSAYIPFDYDGVPPKEIMNDNGRVDRCLSDTYPFQIERKIDLIECWGGGVRGINVDLSGDIDGDGYDDLVCDIGGGGYTARVIRGGPAAGRGCERILHLPMVRDPFGNAVRDVVTIWCRPAGGYRVIYYYTDAWRTWVVMSDLQVHRTADSVEISYTPLDSIRADGFPGQDCIALVQDTIARRDWFLIYKLDSELNTGVLERFDVTGSRFVHSGERVRGTVFYNPIVFGHSFGSNRPVVLFDAVHGGSVFSYIDDLAHPFARWVPTGTGTQPVAGMTTINDQTGDGKPELVISGGQGVILILTLDSAVTGVEEVLPLSDTATATLHGSILEVRLYVPCTVSAELVTTDGRLYPALAAHPGTPGLNRYDLSSVLSRQPRGAYLLRIRTGDTFVTLSLVL
ncbi:MAG: hypothetical protein QY319_07185 [Candidatus Kapaibacterium sp.]|nr:MAG: hypothetical protein QY319_07185 [Candidatus Kapabacteria bacterium]